MTSLTSPGEFRLAIIGCTPGNGHPYSWSAPFNGSDREAMTQECPYSGIPDYLNRQLPRTLRIPGAKVTHVACVGEGGFTAEHVAKCALIPQVADRPTDVIGLVDAAHNNWGALLYRPTDGACWFAPEISNRYAPYEIRQIVDRVGSGDAFPGALIFALQSPDLAEPGQALRFATAASCLAHSVTGDFKYSTRTEIETLMNSSGSGWIAR